MSRTPENLARHELIGLTAELIDSPDSSQEGIKGEVLDETQNTLTIANHQVPKQGRVFRFELQNQKVELDGREILERPEDRL
ncbi:MAG: ribonuclease P protein subunit POP4 [Colwellia polaris]|jgi:ribonuclease P protein subunit POP4